MKKPLILLFLLFCISNFAQVKGSITESDDTPIPSVIISIENTYINAASGDDGNYSLNLPKTGDYTLIVKCMGYKTKKLHVNIPKFPHVLNIKLEKEEYQLKEVVINSKENPANAIIRNAIAHRKENTKKTSRYSADFYSKGIMKTDTKGKKVKILNFDGPYIDSIPKGIVYLSETQSKIIFEKPDRIKETIVASKVSGLKNSYSANYASDWIFDFYDNTIKFRNLVSPIANNAFSYYKYKLEGTFFDENNQMINKIRVTPKKEKSATFDGHIYIVEDSWAIYAVDLNTNGKRINDNLLTNFNVQQNFGYNKTNNLWAKNSQTIEYNTDNYGSKLNYKQTFLYSNYEFKDKFDKDPFSNEIVSFEENSNKQDMSYWDKNRPIVLTDEERKNYVKSDSIVAAKDSINRQQLVLEKKIPETKKTSVTNRNIIFPLPFFNTVQGWNIDVGGSFKIINNSKQSETFIKGNANYGFSEKRARFSGIISHQLNQKNYAKLTVSGGTQAAQFNPNGPIDNIINTVSSLFFEDNYMKLYNMEFAEFKYNQFICNGAINFMAGVEYQQRKALYNNTNLVWVSHDDNYTSNNPMLPNDYVTPPFDTHHLTKASLSAIINFGSRYVARPDKNVFQTDKTYPIIYLNYYNAFLANDPKYNHQFFSGKIDYQKIFGVYGNWSTSLGSGKFIHGNNITFVDYKHFNGNQTHIGTSNKYMNVFNFMPYYINSTNNAYAELHTEYNDSGYITNKILGLNSTRCSINIGFHDLAVPNVKPYSEYTAGLQYKAFRVDYIRSYQDGFRGDGVIIGLTLSNKSNFLKSIF